MPELSSLESTQIKLGADPEFEVHRRDGSFISAEAVITDYGNRKQFGCDGSSSTGEIRTDPGDPEIVVKSISEILTKAARQLSGYGLYAGAGTNVSLGGHIHFSGISSMIFILNELDSLIAIPLKKISNYTFRENHFYGQLGEYRNQPHGWEYRSPCSWISHPLIAAGVLQIAYECAKAYEKTGKTFSSKEELIQYVELTDLRAAEKIKTFYKIIDRMVAKNVKLESVELFQAWRKRPISNQADSVKTAKKAIEFDFSQDDNLDTIRYGLAKCREYGMRRVSGVERIGIVGASFNRTPLERIFVSRELAKRLPKRLCKVKVQVWEFDKIGLSHLLRQNINKSVDVLRLIKYVLKNENLSRENNVDISAIKAIEEEDLECAVLQVI